jgi:hypothetical protein
MRARYSVGVVVAYVIIAVLVAAVVAPRSASRFIEVPYFLEAVIILLLVRYFSTSYTLDDTDLVAWRILGSRRIHLEDVRSIEFANLRDLVTTGGFFGMGSWGWRGRMHSVTIGEFDSVYTDAASGLLVTAGAYPLYISPRDPEGFARELSRRVRSYTGPLTQDVGAPTR